MANHEQAAGETDEWYTPWEIFEALQITFDLDVASPGRDTQHCCVPADDCLTRVECGLKSNWYGTVWMNPPFGGRNGVVPWLKKFMAHGDGIALVPNRTGAQWFELLEDADNLVFVRPKIKFVRPDGTRGRSPGYGAVLVGLGHDARIALRGCNLGLLVSPEIVVP